MAPERPSLPEREASSLTRRNYLRAAGLTAAGVGFGIGAARGETATDAPTIDVLNTDVDHSWTTVQLAHSHADPVVVAPTLPYAGWQSSSPRLRNITGSTFDLRVQEWRYLDGYHLTEQVGGLATDPGQYSIADGGALEVGRLQTNHRWASHSFSASFSTTPLVFSQAQTINGYQPIVTRHRNISTSGLDIRLQEEEAEGAHLTEDIGYLALEPGIGTLDGHTFEAGAVDDVGDDWQTISFTNPYTNPVFLAEIQTFRGGNTCTVRYRNLSETSVEVKVEEEQSSDQETAHLGERVGYLVVESAASATGETLLAELNRRHVEQRIHKRINDQRAVHGVAPLVFDTDLREIARYHSEDMAANDYFSHTDPDGNNFADRYEKFGYDCRAETDDGRYYTGGENIAYTYYQTPVSTANGTEEYTNADELAAGIVRGWMNSDGHRENLLKDVWNVEGIGVAVTSEGKVYATQNFC